MSDLTDRLREPEHTDWGIRAEAADEIDRLIAEVQQLRADNTDLQNKVVMPLRERVRALEQALRNLHFAAVERDNKNRIRQFDDFVDAARAALKGEQ
jgi:hypothetical protein